MKSKIQQITISNCPICNSKLNQSSKSSYVCECGWNYSSSAIKNEKGIQRKIAFQLVLSLMTIIGIGYYVGTWQQYSIEVAPILVSKITANPSLDKELKLGLICEKLARHSCAIDAYKNSLELTHDNTLLGKIGRIQHSYGSYTEAVESLEKYKEKGGSDKLELFTLAKAYMELDLLEKSEILLKTLIDAEPRTLQYSVTQTYVEVLSAQGKLTEALSAIKSFRIKGSKSYFMESELQAINKKLEDQKSS